eukprot:gb/GECH01000327.1/.p1 GENE.gb/GECH01000327.1/~~gb/GECH01000327.1/.p1  ORF type:complete len:1009 (+),score=307.77 gb/GECH01000327.1/:1-3027(+)
MRPSFSTHATKPNNNNHHSHNSKNKLWAQKNNFNNNIEFSSFSSVVNRRQYSVAATSDNVSSQNTLKVLFLTNAHNSMSQRAMLELERQGHSVRVELALNEDHMNKTVHNYHPDLILCPFLTKRIPQEIWENKQVPCLIVHPGIKGDRGIAAIDWALKNNEKEWGVTVLQASEEMDAGDIWATHNFPVNRPISNTPITKASLYRNEVISKAMKGIHEAIQKLNEGIAPEPLNYNDPLTKGRLQPKMKLSDRRVDWSEFTANDIVKIIQYSDSQPGAPADIQERKFRVFNALEEKDISLLAEQNNLSIESIAPGEIIGHRFGALCMKAKDNTAVWISHVKPLNVDYERRFKMPATSAFSESFINSLPYLSNPPLEIAPDEDPKSTWREIWIKREGSVCHIHFEFYNGAMSTDQCMALKQAVDHVAKMKEIKVIILRGGYDFFSNGINLNTIHNSSNPSSESYRNIVAMDDLVRSIFEIEDKVTISTFQGGAGAGGVMLAMATDLTWSHQQVVLNPHYKTMGLFGSEYWTYFLPQRVGQKTAETLTNAMQPVDAPMAHELGMIHRIFGNDTEEFISQMSYQAKQIANDDHKISEILSAKQEQLSEENIQNMESHRNHELRIMKENFEDEAYHRARRRFVLKEEPPVTPLHINNRIRKSRDSNSKINTEITRERSLEAEKMNGTRVADRIVSKIKTSIPHFVEEYQRPPKLCIISVGDRRDSRLYIKKKLEKCESIGIASEWLSFKTDTDIQELEQNILRMNADPTIDGIMVQLPIPGELSTHTQRIISAINPDKDVDCLHPRNLGELLLLNNEGKKSSHKLISQSSSSNPIAPSLLDPSHQIPFAPCTVRGVIEILIHHDVKLTGKNVSIIGKSSIVGQPLSLCLLHHGASVSVYHIQSENIKKGIQNADIVISCAGVPHLIDDTWIKEGAVIVDVGINFIPKLKKKSNESESKPKKKLVGDVHFESVRRKASLITPVPGGVGPVTVAMLMQNTMESFLHNVNNSKTKND